MRKVCCHVTKQSCLNRIEPYQYQYVFSKHCWHRSVLSPLSSSNKNVRSSPVIPEKCDRRHHLIRQPVTGAVQSIKLSLYSRVCDQRAVCQLGSHSQHKTTGISPGWSTTGPRLTTITAISSVNTRCQLNSTDLLPSS